MKNLLLIFLAFLSFKLTAQSFSRSQVYDSLKLTGQNNKVSLFDYDGDGDDDIFCYGATGDSRVLVYHNSNGSFDSSFVFYDNNYTVKDITLIDYDSDSDLDLIVVTASPTNEILKFENLGNGNFNLTIQTNIVPYLNANLDNADIDNDGLPDLVYSSFSAWAKQVRWVKNLGNGNFSSSYDTIANLGDRIRSFELADLDNDGDIDVITQYERFTSITSAMSINDGSGNFNTTLQFPVSTLTLGYTLGDFNNDSLVDLAYANPNRNVTILWNDTANTFSTASTIRNNVLGSDVVPRTVGKFDFDGDGNMDVLVGDRINITAYQGVILKNQGNNTFVEHPEKLRGAAWGDDTKNMFFSDFNNDSNIDILTNSGRDNDLILHLQDSNSNFLYPTYLNHYFQNIHNLNLLDYNNDGHLDLVSTDERNTGKLEVAFGTATNEFDSSTVVIDNKTAIGAVGSQLIFWNNNADYDLLYSSSNKVYVHLDFNTPNDTTILLFTSNTTTPQNGGYIGYMNTNKRVFTVDDIDNDGDNDLIIPQIPGANYYWVENNGGLNSTVHSISSVGFESYLLTDVDGDLDLDFIGQHYNSSTNSTDYYFYKMNPSTKAFTNYLTLSTPNRIGANQFAAGDIDGDNDDDIVISGLMWMENDSAGNFLAPASLVSGYNTLSHIVIDDIDNDGLLDIITNVRIGNPLRTAVVPLFNQGGNVFVPINQNLEVFGAAPHAIAVDDLNGNGFKSIVAGSIENQGQGWTPVLFDFCIHSEDTFNLDVCSGDSYTFADGTFRSNITVNESYTSTLLAQAANGCDSIVTEHINVLPVSNATDVQTACNSFTWIDSTTYTTSTNSPTFTLTNVAGCDSVVTLDLTINSNDTSISVNNNTLTVNQQSASYQWINCDSSYSTINGATNQSFTPSQNGGFACEISLNGCVDTTACVQVIVTGIEKNAKFNDFKVYPNPFADQITIESVGVISNTHLEVLNINGQLVYEATTFLNGKTVLNTIDWAKGIYFIRLTNEQGVGTFKLVHQ